MMTITTFSSKNIHAYTQGKTLDKDNHLDTFPSIWLDQTHSANVVEITESSHLTVLNTDAAVTQLPNLQLKVKHADCLPILFYHPLPIIGAVHAGRKGTQQHIVKNVLLYLKEKHHLKDSLELWFGPAICKSCYQINREKNMHFDLVAENTKQVRQLFSEREAKIVYSNRCTAHENEHFYSYRKEGKGVPMNWSGIVLKS